MSGFRIGRKHAAHTYPESRKIGGAANGGVIVFGTHELDPRGVNFLPPGFNAVSTPPIFDIEMPFRGNLTGLVVRQNTLGVGNGTVLYEVFIGGALAPGFSFSMGFPERDHGATPAPVPFLTGPDDTQRISVKATVSGGGAPNVPPMDITVSLAFSPT